MVLGAHGNIAPEKMAGPKRKAIFQPSIFRGDVSFREGNPGKKNKKTKLPKTKNVCVLFPWKRVLDGAWETSIFLLGPKDFLRGEMLVLKGF